MSTYFGIANQIITYNILLYNKSKLLNEPIFQNFQCKKL